MMLAEAFERVKMHEKLRGIPQEFGGRAALPPASYPCIHWLPTVDPFREPIRAHDKMVFAGKGGKNEGVIEKARLTRDCGCDVILSVEGDTVEKYQFLEQLLNDFIIALYQTLLGLANFHITGGRWLDREQISEGCSAYALSILISTQIYELNSTAVVRTVKVEVPKE